MVIDFTTRRRLDAPRLAQLDIIDYYENPLPENMVLIDGIVPRELARELIAMCRRFNGDSRDYLG